MPPPAAPSGAAGPSRQHQVAAPSIFGSSAPTAAAAPSSSSPAPPAGYIRRVCLPHSALGQCASVSSSSAANGPTGSGVGAGGGRRLGRLRGGAAASSKSARPPAAASSSEAASSGCGGALQQHVTLRVHSLHRRIDPLSQFRRRFGSSAADNSGNNGEDDDEMMQEYRVSALVRGAGGRPLHDARPTTGSVSMAALPRRDAFGGGGASSNFGAGGVGGEGDAAAGGGGGVATGGTPRPSLNAIADAAPPPRTRFAVSGCTHVAAFPPSSSSSLISPPVRWRDLTRDACLELEVLRPTLRDDDPTDPAFDSASSSADIRGGGEAVAARARLNLFERSGRLRTGPVKLRLDWGSSGATTIQVSGETGRGNDSVVADGDDDDEEEDAKWDASVTLHNLDNMYDGTAGHKSAGGRGGGFDAPRPVPWLDRLTRRRCLTVLNDPEDVLGDCFPPPAAPDASGNGHGSAYLIVELPTFGDDVAAVVHEDVPYPPPVHGASGAVTALDLSLHRRRARYIESHPEAAAAFIQRGRQQQQVSSAQQGTQQQTPPQHHDDWSLSLVALLDPESTEEDNASEDKYRTLQHDLLRGLVDPDLKPDRVQRAKLNAVIASPSYHPTLEERDLLWRFRFSLVDNRRALTKFLLAVDWAVEGEVVQAAELLEQWRRRSPIEVTDALKLLGRNVAFRTDLVRQYAIDTLAGSADEELRLYLLQLVQALKYENDDYPPHSAGAGDDNKAGGEEPSRRRLLGRASRGGASKAQAQKQQPQKSAAAASAAAVAATGKKQEVSSLADFLIGRAAGNMDLASYLYWYLKVELDNDPAHNARYRHVFEAFRERLSGTMYEGDLLLRRATGSADEADSHPMSGSAGSLKSGLLGAAASKLRGGGGSSSHQHRHQQHHRHSHSQPSGAAARALASFRGGDGGGPVRSMWDVLLAQDRFISGIMDCQCRSRDARGKKDAKELHLRELLSAGGFRSISSLTARKRGGRDVVEMGPVPLPIAPDVIVTGLRPETARMFKSALYPALVEFHVAEDRGSERRGGGAGEAAATVTAEAAGAKGKDGATSTAQHPPSYKVIVKTGDDLRQDQLVIMMIRLMDRLLKRGTLDLCLRPYAITATSATAGLVEFVDGSAPLSAVLAENGNSVLQYFRSHHPNQSAKYGVQPEVLHTYVRSCAGYCVITYLLGVGDRHLDNIMLLPAGFFFHIDFGFIFGRDPKPLPPAFRLTREMVDGMGGLDSAEYRVEFRSLACQAFNLLRKSAGLVLNLLHLMSDAGIEDLSNNPAADAEGVIAKVEERFRLELNDEQAETYFLGLIDDSLAALAPRVMDVFHQLAVSRR